MKFARAALVIALATMAPQAHAQRGGGDRGGRGEGIVCHGRGLVEDFDEEDSFVGFGFETDVSLPMWSSLLLSLAAAEFTVGMMKKEGSSKSSKASSAPTSVPTSKSTSAPTSAPTSCVVQGGLCESNSDCCPDLDLGEFMFAS